MSQPASNTGNAAAASSRTNTLPSVAMTARFLALCDAYGSQQLAIHIVAAGRTSGVAGLPATNDWPEWDACEMRAAVEHRGMRSSTSAECGSRPRGPPRRGRPLQRRRDINNMIMTPEQLAKRLRNVYIKELERSISPPVHRPEKGNRR